MTTYVYILASKPKGTLYIGFTGDLAWRVYEHREGAIPGFTRKCGVCRLVHFETFDDANSAQQREKNLKRWNRQWKIDLIQHDNPDWQDLYDDLNNLL
jgi:putative endonuclease